VPIVTSVSTKREARTSAILSAAALAGVTPLVLR
jgi:hypothetical protein